MATNSPYSQKVIKCRGRACAKCGYCRDWYFCPNARTKTYTKRQDATCASAYAYGRPGYGPGCAGWGRCCLARIPFGNCCAQKYNGGDGYGHGAGIALSGFLKNGLSYDMETLAGVDHDARRRQNENANLAGLVIGGNLANMASGLSELTDGTASARRALFRAHHDEGRLCECSDNQQ